MISHGILCIKAGALISIGVLIFNGHYRGYINDAAAQIWSADNNPWVQLENTWATVYSVEGGANASNYAEFYPATWCWEEIPI